MSNFLKINYCNKIFHQFWFKVLWFPFTLNWLKSQNHQTNEPKSIKLVDIESVAIAQDPWSWPVDPKPDHSSETLSYCPLTWAPGTCRSTPAIDQRVPAGVHCGLLVLLTLLKIRSRLLTWRVRAPSRLGMLHPIWWPKNYIWIICFISKRKCI